MQTLIPDGWHLKVILQSLGSIQAALLRSVQKEFFPAGSVLAVHTVCLAV